MANELTLGGIIFSGWEMPEELPLGGKQLTVVHKLIGGARVVDKFGPDPNDIAWKGRFRGPDAMSRAQALDAMRQAGAEVPLTWNGLYYTVVIQEFVFRPQKAFEVPYTICCIVSDDPTQSAGGGFGGIGLFGSTLDSLIAGDLGSIAGLVSSLGGFGDFSF